MIRKYGGLDPLVALLSNRENKPLLAAATGKKNKYTIENHINTVAYIRLKYD